MTPQPGHGCGELSLHIYDPGLDVPLKPAVPALSAEAAYLIATTCPLSLNGARERASALRPHALLKTIDNATDHAPNLIR